ncbi:MAG TPA: TonB-dependent receptor, partial [Ramlibacter sp.]|nr:TonB-dependent receptor [Ramlibacter sp.]
GYYENFTLRGFTLDAGSSYRINGFVVPGEYHIVLDNKEAIEILKGLGSLTGGSVGAGGIVNFRSNRPADVRSVRAELGSRGGSYLGLDIGRAARENDAIGFRLKVAHEEMRPAEAKAEGRRDFASLALDAHPHPQWTVMFDAEYSRRAQPAVPGFQLLGGTVLPEPDPFININRQPWSRPVRNEGHLLALRATYDASPDTKISIGASDARARIDDSLAFPFGCNDAPYHYFCADGSYVLYDYRAFERRRTRHAQAGVTHTWRANGWQHDLHIGAENINRRIEQDQLYSTTLYDAAGLALSGNLATTALALPAPPALGVDQPPRRATQSAFFIADQVSWNDWRANLGLRIAKVRQTAGAGEHTHALPQLGLVWRQSPSQRFYVSVSRGLEFGSEAPVVAQNAGQHLAPRLTSQFEAGWRREWGTAHSASIALFRTRRPFEFTEVTGTSWAGLGDFVQAGQQVHTGLEAHGTTRIAAGLNLSAQVSLLRAIARGTGVAGYDSTQVQNVPRVRTNLALAYTPPSLPQLDMDLRWLHVGARNARRDGSVQVPGYDRVDAGVGWTVGARDGRQVNLRLAVQNLANQRYWRDVGEAYSADLLFPGRPRTITFGIVVSGL